MWVPIFVYYERFLDRGLQCATCPDPANCARLLEEKWKQAYNAVFRFGSLFTSFSVKAHLT